MALNEVPTRCGEEWRIFEEAKSEGEGEGEVADGKGPF